jgi:hypothetical protein
VPHITLGVRTGRCIASRGPSNSWHVTKVGRLAGIEPVFGVASPLQTRLLGLLVDGQEATGCRSHGIPRILATETGGSGQHFAAANGG